MHQECSLGFLSSFLFLLLYGYRKATLLLLRYGGEKENKERERMCERERIHVCLLDIERERECAYLVFMCVCVPEC